MRAATSRYSPASLARGLAEIAIAHPALWQAALRELRRSYPCALDPVTGDQTISLPPVTDDTAPLDLDDLARDAARQEHRTRLTEQLRAWAVATFALAGSVLLISVALYCTDWGWKLVMGR